MKGILTSFFIILIAVSCLGQPNTSTTLEVGIINPQPEKSYKVFFEIKNDSLPGQLQEGMDYLNPDVSGLLIQLENQHTSGDTLFGEKTYQDLDHIRYLKAGLVQVDNQSQKYSAMKVSQWVPLDQIEPNQAGFFIRKK